ncbi:MAG: hypothetical protein IMZ53_02335 [Thermoplasmata archaeon]|nr:hypothetical protein [Thermoplasmata archaeon]MBE3139399.1 hypothetical protein [Thermoplasmata archaeon]
MVEKEKNNRRLLVRIEPTFTQLKSRKPIFSMFFDRFSFEKTVLLLAKLAALYRGFYCHSDPFYVIPNTAFVLILSSGHMHSILLEQFVERNGESTLYVGYPPI